MKRRGEMMEIRTY